MLLIRDLAQIERHTQTENKWIAGGEGEFYANRNLKKDEVLILVSHKIDFKTKSI